MMTLILTFSLREKEPDCTRTFVGTDSLSLRERARVRVTGEVMNLFEA